MSTIAGVKEAALRYEMLRRQPGLHEMLEYTRSFYREIYDECNLQTSKIVKMHGGQHKKDKEDQPATSGQPPLHGGTEKQGQI